MLPLPSSLGIKLLHVEWIEVEYLRYEDFLRRDCKPMFEVLPSFIKIFEDGFKAVGKLNAFPPPILPTYTAGRRSPWRAEEAGTSASSKSPLRGFTLVASGGSLGGGSMGREGQYYPMLPEERL